MKSMVKNLIMLVVVFLLALLSGYFISNEYVQYGILVIVFSVVILIFSCISFINGRDPTKTYESRIKNTLNTYDSILVRNKEVPSLENRNIIMLYEFQDLVNAQMELRRPICYIKQIESCSFILLDGTEAWVYIDKLNEDVVSPIEIEINNMKRVLKKEEEIEQELLKKIERTTIIKLPNSRSYKISPIRTIENNENHILNEETTVSNSEKEVKAEDSFHSIEPKIVKVFTKEESEIL